ncbi:MAG TPA: carboxypeptidase-like regulatory domain-containing protein, partial [Bryobacteraceae bacterium]|nr:carboxypeptidase-like regulatory domain-containing protein [Bryobacteraceae bacterium]
MKNLLTLLFALALASASLYAQEARGSIQGRVTDPTGAIVPNAAVTVTNTATNSVRRLVTNDTGYYEANLLEPSTYTVGVEAQGFKKVIRSGITLNVSARIEIDVALEIGGVAETVEVTGEAPLLETTSASGGRVLDNRQILNLPFSDTNPFALTALAPGMQWTGQPEYRRPFDNGGTSAFNTAGGVGQNEYTIDGMTVTGTGRRVGFTPPSDSVGEFKLETSNFDASQGFTSGAAINVSSRSGTNAFHGALFDQHWQQRWNATPFFTREPFDAGVRSGTIPSDRQKQATGRSNNYSMTASGPVFIPKILNLKDKLFWTFTWNGIRQSKAETTSSTDVTVPTDAMKQGDFSYFLTVPNGATLYTIYDPRSATLQGSTVVRTPFPGNKGVPVLNPTAAYYSKLYPTPNNISGKVSPDLLRNYFASAMPKDEKFNAIVNRYDWAVTQNHRVNVRWQWNDRLADEYDFTYETARGLHSNGLTRINKGGNIGYIWTINSSNILDAGFGISRFEEGARNATRTQVTAAQVGLPAYIDERAGANTQLPRLDFDKITDFGGSYPAITDKSNTYEYRAAMTTIMGSHSFKYGWQERRNLYASSGPGSSTGFFRFRRDWTRSSNTDTLATDNHVHEWAAFLMGLPSAEPGQTNISIDYNDSAYWRMPRRAFYFQDDWRVTNKLRLSLGLRYEFEGGIDERFNRGIAAPIFNEASPITSMVEAAYAANPLSDLAASSFKATGITRYLGTDGFNTTNKGVKWMLPKFGAVYSLNPKTVIRGGWGMYADTQNVANSRPNQNGFSQATGTPVSNDSGLTFCCGVGGAAGLTVNSNPMADPFPVRTASGNTRFDDPYGNTLAGLSRYGNGWDTINWDNKPALQHRWRIGFQRELARNLMVDVSYNGSYSYLPVLARLNPLPEKYWSTGNKRNSDNDKYLTTNFKNPYNIANLAGLKTSNAALYQWASGNGFFTNTNMQRQQLLRPLSMYANIRAQGRIGEDSWNGYMDYHDFSVLLERRFTGGFQSTFMYTRATSTVADWMANEFDAAPTARPNNNTLPHRIAWSAVYETPFGKGRRFVSDGPMSHIVGNWNLSWVYQLQSGPTTGDWNNLFFYGDESQLANLWKHDEMRAKDYLSWFDPSLAYRGVGDAPSTFVGFEGRATAQPGTYHVRMTPIRQETLRADGIFNIDLKVERLFPINPEKGVQARFAFDMLNATNHTNFGQPERNPTSGKFGSVTSQRGLSRVLQFTLRF